MRKAREAQEKLYFDTCTITEYREHTNPNTGLSDFSEVSVYENLPCKLSFESLKEAQTTGSTVKVSQITKLFISPDVEIKPGSKISVTREGKTTDYTYSGVPMVDQIHQEIVLSLFEGWV